MLEGAGSIDLPKTVSKVMLFNPQTKIWGPFDPGSLVHSPPKETAKLN